MKSRCCPCVCVSFLSLLGNGYVFYAVHVVSKKSRWLVLLRTCCNFLPSIVPTWGANFWGESITSAIYCEVLKLWAEFVWIMTPLKEYHPVCYNSFYFGNSLTFRRNISPPTSGPKSKPSKKSTEAGGKPEDGGYTCLRSTGEYNPEDRTRHSDRCQNMTPLVPPGCQETRCQGA
jgi:hypothetical protein